MTYFTATATFTTHINCEHKNGWFIYPKFWIFKRKYLLCTDCGDLIPKSDWYLEI